MIDGQGYYTSAPTSKTLVDEKATNEVKAEVSHEEALATQHLMAETGLQAERDEVSAGRVLPNDASQQDEDVMVQTKQRKILSWFLGAFKILIFFGFSTLLTALLGASLQFGCSSCFHGGWGLFGMAILTISIVSIFFLLMFVMSLFSYQQYQNRKQQRIFSSDEEENRSTSDSASDSAARKFPSDCWIRIRRFALRILLPFAIIQLIGFEIFLMLQAPNSSLFPIRPPYAEYALSEPGGSEYAPEGCSRLHIEIVYNIAKEMYVNNTEFYNYLETVNDGDGIPLIYMPRGNGDVAAFVFDQTIYIPLNQCPQAPLLVHELVHVYQEHIGYFTPSRVAEYIVNYIRCWECLYDYGGYDNLVATMELASATDDATLQDIHTAFGSEQMAEIVQDYFYENYYGSCRYANPTR